MVSTRPTSFTGGTFLAPGGLFICKTELDCLKSLKLFELCVSNARNWWQANDTFTYRLVVWNQRELNAWRWKIPGSGGGSRACSQQNCLPAKVPLVQDTCSVCGGGWVEEGSVGRGLIHFPGIFNEAPISFPTRSCLGAASLVGVCWAFPREPRGHYQRFAPFFLGSEPEGSSDSRLPSPSLWLLAVSAGGVGGGDCFVWLIGSCLAWGLSGVHLS